MNTCEQIQSTLLAHLYGLLDERENQAVLAHLGNCPACQAALEKAHGQREVMAAAAKASFPTVRFDPANPGKKRVQAPAARRSLARRWAVAACVLLLLGGAGSYTGLAFNHYDRDVVQTWNELHEAEDARFQVEYKFSLERARMDEEAAKVQEQLRQIEIQYRNDLGRVQRDLESQAVQFRVTHPKTIQAGARNQLTVEAKAKAAPQVQMVAVLVDDKTQKEIFRKTLHDGVNDVVLPADLPLSQGTQLSLRVLGTEKSGAEEKVLVQETLPLVTSLFVTHVMTDRPLYRPGEPVLFRSLTLERFSLKPATELFDLHFRLVRMLGQQEQVIQTLSLETHQPVSLSGTTRLKDQSGKTVLGPDGKELAGIAAGAFWLPGDLPGGEYSLIVREAHERFPAEKRSFLVNRYQAPRFYKDVDFTRKSYGPGDTVTAQCKVAPVEGGRVMANCKVAAQATVDGVPCQMLTEAMLKTDDNGTCAIQFKLPANIERGEGVLSVTFVDDGVVETSVEPIPIVLKKLRIEFFPEGGDLVAGTVNRVYFQARTPLLKPAEMRGQVVDKAGRVVAGIRTFGDDRELGANQGMGRFEFMPEEGQSYELKIESPEGIEGKFALPPVQRDGVVLRMATGVVSEAIDLQLTSAKKDRKLLVGAYCRGVLVDSQTVTAEAGRAKEVALKAAPGIAGVYRVTVFEVAAEDGALKPMAERLVYRRPQDKIHLQITADKNAYAPGEHVNLALSATDKDKRPVPVVAVVSVVDKSILKLRNERTARSLPTHFLLTSEIRGPDDLEYADFLLLEEPRSALGLETLKAQVALDLLLGTQGWRRFVEQKTPAERAASMALNRDDTTRLLTSQGQAPKQAAKASFVADHIDTAARETIKKHEETEKKLAELEAVHDGKLKALRDEWNVANLAVSSKASTLTSANSTLEMFKSNMLEGLALLVVSGFGLASLLAFLSALTRVSQGRPRAGVCLGLSAAWIVGLVFCVVIVFRFGNNGLSDNRMFGIGLAWHPPIVPENGIRIIGGSATVAGDLGQLPEIEGLIIPADQSPRSTVDSGYSSTSSTTTSTTGTTSSADVKQNVQLKDGTVRLGRPNAPLTALQAPAPNPAKQPVPAQSIVAAEAPVPYRGLQDDDGTLRRENGLLGIENTLGRLPEPMVPNFARERQLRKESQFAVVTKGRLAVVERELGLSRKDAEFSALAASEPFVLRQYAHMNLRETMGPAAEAVRRDFAETVYWHPAIVLPGDSPLTVDFDLSDAVTRFEVKVWCHTLDGRLAAATTDIAARLPLSIDAKVPIEIGSSDKPSIPVNLRNDSEKNLLVNLAATSENLLVISQTAFEFELPAGAGLRKVFQLKPATAQGLAKVKFLANGEPSIADSLERTFTIVPDGFPVAGKHSGMLKGSADLKIVLPARREDWVAETMKLQAQVFPSTLADLQKSLESLLREPHGCFEQTSSSNYPNIMILDFLKESGKLEPAIEKQALALLDRGYERLLTFECVDAPTRTTKEGYEWFGQTAPPHQALTAYGLLEFIDMQKHRHVDAAMLERTVAYLLKQRDGKGGFLRNQGGFDGFGKAPPNITDAYIVWALSEAQVKEDLGPEVKTVVSRAEKSGDPYQLALASLALLKRGETDAALPLLKLLQNLQKEDGSLVGADTSITNSHGSQLTIETTSLALLAWLRAGQPKTFGDNIQRGVTWIGKQRGAFGGYGSTQSTILALKALIAYTKENQSDTEAGELELRLFVGNRPEPVAVRIFKASALEPIVVELPDEDFLVPGENRLRVECTAKNALPFTLSWSYMAVTPANDKSCPVRLTAMLSASKAAEGESLRVTANLENVSGQDQGMAVAIVGLPGGCMLPGDLQELRNLVRAGTVDAFEIRGREVVFYWRGLGKGASREVNFTVICQVPGAYRGPASRGYLYYDADQRWWSQPLAVEIGQRGGG